MFDTYYEVRFASKREAMKGEPFLIEHKFTFSCKHNHQYIIDIEEYDYHFFVGKFYLKNHSDSDRKFKLHTGFKDASRVISTCTRTLLSFYDKNPYSSFGFMGAASENELLKNTKRFRIYKQYIQSIVSPIHFDHKIYEDKSCYLLINKLTTQNIPDILEKIEGLFENIIQFHDLNSEGS